MSVGTSFEQFANEIRAFNDRRAVINAVRRDLRKPIPAFRKDVRKSALETLPSAGGFNKWVARSSLTVRLRDRGRSAGVTIKMSRKSEDGDKADLNILDITGGIRHPLYGNRRFWYGQRVPRNFFTKPWGKFRGDFLRTCDEAFDKALEVIRRG